MGVDRSLSETAGGRSSTCPSLFFFSLRARRPRCPTPLAPGGYAPCILTHPHGGGLDGDHDCVFGRLGRVEIKGREGGMHCEKCHHSFVTLCPRPLHALSLSLSRHGRRRVLHHQAHLVPRRRLVLGPPPLAAQHGAGVCCARGRRVLHRAGVGQAGGPPRGARAAHPQPEVGECATAPERCHWWGAVRGWRGGEVERGGTGRNEPSRAPIIF